jgi:hypothetical protein
VGPREQAVLWQQVMGCLLQSDAPAGPAELAAMWQLVVWQGLVLYMPQSYISYPRHNLISHVEVGECSLCHRHTRPAYTMTGRPEKS